MGKFNDEQTLDWIKSFFKEMKFVENRYYLFDDTKKILVLTSNTIARRIMEGIGIKTDARHVSERLHYIYTIREATEAEIILYGESNYDS